MTNIAQFLSITFNKPLCKQSDRKTTQTCVILVLFHVNSSSQCSIYSQHPNLSYILFSSIFQLRLLTRRLSPLVVVVVVVIVFHAPKLSGPQSVKSWRGPAHWVKTSSEDRKRGQTAKIPAATQKTKKKTRKFMVANINTYAD